MVREQQRRRFFHNRIEVKVSIHNLLRGIPVVLGLVWYAIPVVKAAEQRIECPREIPAEDVRVVRAPTGWTSFVAQPGIALNGASLMNGPPAGMAVLQPTDVGRSNEDVWTDMRPGRDGMWMACFYGQHQDIILATRLPDSTKECRIAYSQDKFKRVKMDIRCR